MVELHKDDVLSQNSSCPSDQSSLNGDWGAQDGAELKNFYLGSLTQTED